MLRDGYFPAELINLGFSGKSLDSTLKEWIQREHFTQFILFTHNFESPKQLIDLTNEIQSLTQDHLPLMISADQEGGRVQRFRTGFTRLPSAQWIGQNLTPKETFELARIQAWELRMAGIQLNFSPVADLNTNPKNPVIGDRSFGADPMMAVPHIIAVIRAHLEAGVEPCLKHFPGHGDTSVDSHFALPEVTTPLETLQTREWIPFARGIATGAKMIMSAHVMLRTIDPDRPGTLSSRFLKDTLRGHLHFQGAIISDDMEMHAITQHFGPTEAPILALNAGCDLLCYRTQAASEVALEAIKKSIQDGILNPNQLEASIDRLRNIRKMQTLVMNETSVVDRLAQIGSDDHLRFFEKHPF